MSYAGPTAAACWHKNLYPFPKHKCELASKPFRLQPEDRQPESPITAYPDGYISDTFYTKLKQAKTSNYTQPTSTRIALRMCHLYLLFGEAHAAPLK